jgi:hypothetical protein
MLNREKIFGSSIFTVIIVQYIQITPVSEGIYCPGFHCVPDSTTGFIEMKTIIKPALF